MKTLNRLLTLMDILVPPIVFFALIMGIPGSTSTAQSMIIDVVFRTIITVSALMLFMGVVSLFFELKERVSRKFIYVHFVVILVLVFSAGLSVSTAFSDSKLYEVSADMQAQEVECHKIKPSTTIKDPDTDYELNIDDSRFSIDGCYLMPEHYLLESIKIDNQYFVVLRDKQLDSLVAFDELLLMGRTDEYDNYIEFSDTESAKTVLRGSNGAVFASLSGFANDDPDLGFAYLTKYNLNFIGNRNQGEEVRIDL